MILAAGLGSLLGGWAVFAQGGCRAVAWRPATDSREAGGREHTQAAVRGAAVQLRLCARQRLRARNRA